MANIEKILCRVGLAHGADLTRMAMPRSDGPTFGGWDDNDVHKAMSYLPPEQRAITYLIPNPGMVSANDLAALTTYLWRRLMQFEAKRRTPPPENPTRAEAAVYRAASEARDKRHAAMVRTALDEYQDPRTCRTCRGNGKLKVPVLMEVEGRGKINVVMDQLCVACEARGWKAWSDNRRARSIGGDRNAYVQRIAPGYEHVLRECTHLHRKGVEAFKGRLFGPAEGLMKETA